METVKVKHCCVDRGGCGVTKRLTEYHRNHHNRDGMSNICGGCINKKNAIQRKVNEINKEKQMVIKLHFYRFIGINPRNATKATKMLQRKK
jgi:hypothetical protein